MWGTSSEDVGCSTPTLVTFEAPLTPPAWLFCFCLICWAPEVPVPGSRALDQQIASGCALQGKAQQHNRRSHASAALPLNCQNYYVFQTQTNYDLQRVTKRLTGGIREPTVAGAVPHESCYAHLLLSTPNRGNPGRNRDRGPEARPQQQHTAGYDPTRSPCPTWIVLSFEHLRARLLPFSSVDSERTSTAVDNVAYVILTSTGENAAALRRRENQNRTRMRFSGHRLRIKIRI